MDMNQRFKEIRLALNLTHKEYAEKINLKPNTVAVIESGRRGVSDETLRAILFAFDVDPDWLLHGKGDMFMPRTLDDDLAEKFNEILDTESENMPMSHIKKLCLLEILNFNSEQWNNLIKTVARICNNSEVQTYSENLQTTDFDVNMAFDVITKLVDAANIDTSTGNCTTVSIKRETIDDKGVLHEES